MAREVDIGIPLWAKLTGVFAAIIVVGIVVTVVLARQGTVTQLSHFMVGNQMVQPAELQTALADYYARQGSWNGIEAVLPQLVLSASGGGMMGGMMGHMMGMFDSRVYLLDETGDLVAGVGDGQQSLLPGAAIEQGWPIVVSGRRVGTLVIAGPVMTMTGVGGESLASGVTRAVLIAGLVAGLVALLLGALLVRQITRPLAALNEASQRIASGERNVRVSALSNDEVGQLAHTFNRMAESLTAQERLRRDLMADVAHELRTPLSGIQGTVEAMQDGIFPLTAENLASIHEQIVLLNRLVEDLRILAHAEAGQLSLNIQSVDLTALAARQVTAHQIPVQQKGIELSLRAQDDLPSIRGDAERLNQVLGNLLTNALRHTPPGGCVEVSLSAQEGAVQISVADSGEGIPSDDLPHVFERFYRGDHSRSRQTGGSGLGLAIARQLVEAHGGHIWAESPPAGRNQGSGFYVLLPTHQLRRA